ncbi:MAG: DUF3822 family protein [Ferruginibacter sp.]
MKTAFKILPDSTISHSAEVLLEVNWCGVSVLWYTENVKVEGVALYTFNNDISAEDLVTYLQTVVRETNINDRTISVFYNFKESILIPGEFFKEETLAAQLKLLYGFADSIIKHEAVLMPDYIGSKSIFNAYRIPVVVNDFFKSLQLQNARHATSCTLVAALDNTMHCTIFSNTIKVIAYANGNLLLVQQFQYKTPTDAVYYLLSICAANGLAVEDVTLFLDGLIEVESNLYEEIYKYFLNINIASPAEDITFAEELQTYPPHFFSHLAQLAKCG